MLSICHTYFVKPFCTFPPSLLNTLLYCLPACTYFCFFNKNSEISACSRLALSFFSFPPDSVQVASYVGFSALFFTTLSLGITKTAVDGFHFHSDYVLIISVTVYPSDRRSNPFCASLLLHLKRSLSHLRDKCATVHRFQVGSSYAAGLPSWRYLNRLTYDLDFRH